MKISESLLESLSKNVDGIYIAGGNINSILKNTEWKYGMNSQLKWFKENIKKYGSIIIETTGIEKLSNKIRNLV